MVENPVEGVRRLARGALRALVQRIRASSAAIGIGEERGGGDYGGDSGSGESDDRGARERFGMNGRERAAVIEDWRRGNLGIF